MINSKLKSLLIVTRPDIKNTWWHRLSNVLIFGSTAIVFLAVSIGIFSDPYSWKDVYVQANNYQPSADAKPIPNEQIFNSTPNVVNNATQWKVSPQKLAGSLGVSIAYTIGWFILWESIFYRSIVYIVMGKGKDNAQR
jgi:hypothetical protein